MIDKKYEFQVKDSGGTYNVYKEGKYFVLDYEDGRPVGTTYTINDDPNNWLNITERHYFDSEPKEPKLTLPIAYRNKHFQEDLRLLVRGSEGHVSVFEEGLFSADEWTDDEVIEKILQGKFLVQSVGNVSFGD